MLLRDICCTIKKRNKQDPVNPENQIKANLKNILHRMLV